MRESRVVAPRAHRREDLLAIAELAYHYLMNGAVHVAQIMFDGLADLAPNEPYFALGLGLASDRASDRPRAIAAYARAAELDPKDGRPDVNLAELYLDAGDLERAKQLLARGAEKARRRQDVALERKARAILTHLEHGDAR